MANSVLELNQGLEEEASAPPPSTMNLELGLEDEEANVNPQQVQQAQQAQPDLSLMASFGKVLNDAKDFVTSHLSNLKEDTVTGLEYGASQLEDWANVLARGINYVAYHGGSPIDERIRELSPDIPYPARLTPEFTHDKRENLSLYSRTVGTFVANLPIAIVTLVGGGAPASLLARPFRFLSTFTAESFGQALGDHIYHNFISDELDKSDLAPETKAVLKYVALIGAPVAGGATVGRAVGGLFNAPFNKAADIVDASTGGAIRDLNIPPEGQNLTTAQALRNQDFKQAATNLDTLSTTINKPSAVSKLTKAKDAVSQEHIKNISSIVEELSKNSGDVGREIGIRIAKLGDDFGAALVGEEGALAAAKSNLDDIVRESLPYLTHGNGEIGKAIVKAVGSLYDAGAKTASDMFGALRRYDKPIALPEDLRPLFGGAPSVSMNDIINKVTVLTRSRNPEAMEAGWKLIDSVGEFLPKELADDYLDARQFYARFKQAFSDPAIQEILKAHTGAPGAKIPGAIPGSLGAKVKAGKDVAGTFEALDRLNEDFGLLGKNVGDLAQNFSNLPLDTKSLASKAVVWSYIQNLNDSVQRAIRNAGVRRNQDLNAASDAVISSINRIESLVDASQANLKEVGAYNDIKTVLSAYKTAVQSGGIDVVPKVAFAVNGRMLPLVESAMSGGAESIRSVGEAFTKNPALKSKVSALLAKDLSTASLKELGTWLDGTDALKSEALKAFMTKDDIEKLKTLYDYTKSLNALRPTPGSVELDTSIAGLLKDAVSSVANFASNNPGVSNATAGASTLKRIGKWIVRAPDEDLMADMLVNPSLAKDIINYRQNMKRAVNATRLFFFLSNAMRPFRDQANKDRIEEARRAKQTSTVGGFKQAIIQQSIGQ
jgi:hypothetical protein